MKSFISSLFILLTITSYAQPKKVLADKIVGVVGDRIILKSDIDNSIDDAKRNGQDVPPDANCYIMQQALIRKALVIQSEKDSVPVGEEEIEQDLEQRIRYFIQQYGGKEKLEEISGRTIYQIKEDFRQTVKEQRMADAMRNKIVENIKITPAEVKAYFEAIPKDSLPYFESELEVAQIVLYPKPNRELEKYAQEQLAEYKKQVESGSRKFETLAKLYSDDPGTKDNGGYFEFNRNDRNVDKNFILQAYKLKEGQVSPVFKSQFGYHIIQMISRSGDDMAVRHILKIPPVTQDEVNEAIMRLDSVRSKIVAGVLDFGEAVGKYSEDDNSKFTAGRHRGKDGSSFVTIDELDKGIVQMLDKLKVGEISQPTAYKDERDKQGVRIVYLVSKTQPHRLNMKDDYNRIAQNALEEKKAKHMTRWFEQHIPTYYIMIDQSYQGCNLLDIWLHYATKQ
ncbi:MAG: peptidylprolyl isomerase [Sphingobacteriales bacterium]|nr:peptidylprolyl isomerase [Sphingobacteriales bacterium]MBI3720325.1 peptidylprolyl isomerase [Sphingobacteriales bacterium]